MSQAADTRSVRFRYLTLFLLTVVYAFNVLDRFILSVLLPQIKAELALSDTQLGLLTGAAFALFYAVLAVPIARFADRGNRKSIISFCLFFFSLMSALCGLAANFFQLLLARMGVGIGEAGTNPASMSIISDLFERERRATAMAIYTIGGNVGLLLGFAAGGLIAAEYGWRVAFFAVGIPGMLFAIVTSVFLKEPDRGTSDNAVVARDKMSAPSMGEIVRFLAGQNAFRHLLLGSALLLLVTNGVIAWLPSYLDRSHGLRADEIGLWLGIAFGGGGAIGTLLIGGFLADWMAKRDVRWTAWIVVIGALVLAPTYTAVFLAPSAHGALIAFAIPAILGVFFQAPTLSMTQSLTPAPMRATAAALLLLVGSLIGLGLGPLMIGLLSDALQRSGFGDDSLRYALLSVVPIACWGALHFLFAARSLSDGYRNAADGSRVADIASNEKI